MKDDILKSAKDLWTTLSSVSRSSHHSNHINWIPSREFEYIYSTLQFFLAVMAIRNQNNNALKKFDLLGRWM